MPTDLSNSSRPGFGRHFLTHFMILSVIGGITIGMGKVVTTFYALHIGASSLQLGFIASAEALGRLLVTLPAGFLTYKYGARVIYSIASLGPMLLSGAIPWIGAWWGVAAVRGLSSLCIPFRIVSMNTSFLQQLRTLGASKAGWYRGSQQFGMAILGPLAGSFAVGHTSFFVSYLLLSVAFGFMAFYGRTFLPDTEHVDAAPAHTDNQAGEGMIAQVRTMLGNAEIAESCATEFVSTSVNSMFTTFIIVIAVSVAKLSEQQAIALLTVQGGATVASLFCLGYLLHRMSRRTAQSISFVLIIAGLALLGSRQDLDMLMLGTVLLSAGTALIHLVKMAQLSELQLSKSKISGLYNLVGMFGALVGALGGGVLGEYLGLQSGFLLYVPIVAVLGVYCHLRAGATLRSGPLAEP